MRILSILLLISIVLLSSVYAKTDFFKEFETNYKLLDVDMVNNPGEALEVSNFVYKKDLATFTFTEGTLYLIRFVQNRPTTALFMGKGHASIDIPSHAERQSLRSISKDSVINEDFEICVIRFADDFDLAVKEQFTAEPNSIKWKVFSPIRQARGDFYFNPTIEHPYDNNFQQLRSLYERNADGYFWIDFNRYNYSYDPNRPNEVLISYEFENNDFYMTDAVVLPGGLTDEIKDVDLSNFTYPTTTVSKEGSLNVGGLDGSKIFDAQIDLKITINKDSLKFINLYLDDQLKLDSLKYKGNDLDYYRRKDFKILGAILPEYAYKNDTLTFSFFYHGDDYIDALPYVLDPQPSRLKLAFTTPSGYNYLMPSKSEETADGKEIHFNVEPAEPYKQFQFMGYATGFDTVDYDTPLGFNINIIKSTAYDKSIGCFVPHEIYDSSIINNFSVMTSLVGNPIGTFELFVQPESSITMPGLVGLPQINCYLESNVGSALGFDLYAAEALAQQWFGRLMKPKTDREFWVEHALTQYLALMTLQSRNNSTYYTSLLIRKDTLNRMNEIRKNRPMSNGERINNTTFNNRGAWMMHMLRFLMFDTESGSDNKFRRFFYQLAMLVNTKTFTNADIIALAEEAYGQPLDWFFNQWLFNTGYPKFDVAYTPLSEGGQHYVDVKVKTTCDIADFKMPIVIRVGDNNGSSKFVRQTVTTGDNSFRLGPFDFPVEEFVFNELYSVLADADVKKK